MRTVVDDGIDTARLVVQEIDVVRAPCLSDQLPVRIVVIVGRAAILLLRAQSVCPVLVACDDSVMINYRQLSAVLPREVIRASVVVACWIPYLIVGNGRSVIACLFRFSGSRTRVGYGFHLALRLKSLLRFCIMSDTLVSSYLNFAIQEEKDHHPTLQV